MPLESIKDNKYIGIGSEYINLLKDEVPVDITLQITKNWEETVDLIKSGKCDIMPISKNSEKSAKYFDFTNSYLDYALVVATKNGKLFISDISTLSEKKFGLLKNSIYKESLKQTYPDIKIVEVKNIQEGLKKVNKGEIYGQIDAQPIIGYEIQKNYLGNLKIDGQIGGEYSLSIATNKNEPLLNRIFNKLIKNITDEEKNVISKKWLAVNYQQTIDYKKLLWVILFFTIIIVIIVYKNKRINQINEEMEKNLELISKNVIISRTDKRGKIVDVSQAFCDISGYSKEELIGKPHNIVRHEDMPSKFFEELWKTIQEGKTWTGEVKNKNKDGHIYWVYTTISPYFDDKKNIIGYRSIRTNITDKKRIEQLSITDELTTLYNKRYFNIMLEKEINRISRSEQMFAFMIFDVDHFKQYNDNYGHQKGDYVLSSIGKKINSLCKRSSDFSFRIGGEEFAIIFQSNTHESAVIFAEVVRKAIEELKIEHKYNSAGEFISISIGLYTATADNIETSKEIYKITDERLYKAKSNGRNRVEFQ